MEQVLSGMPISDELAEALLSRGGALGEVLDCTLAYEHGEWSRVVCAGLSRGQIKGAFLGAVEWADRVDRDMRAMVV